MLERVGTIPISTKPTCAKHVGTRSWTCQAHARLPRRGAKSQSSVHWATRRPPMFAGKTWLRLMRLCTAESRTPCIKLTSSILRLATDDVSVRCQQHAPAWWCARDSPELLLGPRPGDVYQAVTIFPTPRLATSFLGLSERALRHFRASAEILVIPFRAACHPKLSMVCQDIAQHLQHLQHAAR